MKKGARKKIKQVILSVLFLGQIFLSPMMVGASSLINWENPNKNGDNPYKIDFSNIINSGLLTQVVACTGVTNKIAGVIFGIENSLKDLVTKLKEKKQRARMCNLVKGAAESVVGAVMQVNNLPQALEAVIDCDAYANQVFDPETSEAISEQTAADDKRELIRTCFNGIAYTLAKNQLTSIARNTLNWVNSGFSGDPVYVQNVTLALQNVERSIVEPAIEELSYGAFPWGNTFIQSRIERIANRSSYAGDTSLLSRTASDLANYIKNDFKYNSELSELDNQRIRAESAVRTFANDFSSGGWTGWLSMIINDNNNYLGYQSRASRVLQEKVEEQQKALQTELEQNDGYYNQTECVKWQRYNEDGTPMRPVDTLQYGNIIGDSPLYNLGQSKFGSFSLRSSGQDVFSDTKWSDYDVCVETRAITPGSNIKTRVDTTLGIPERQLEIADDVNDVLNSVFSVLLSVLQDQGLSGLSSGEYTYTNSNIGIRTFSGSANEGGLNNYSSGSSSYDSFNLTRDLGNTFIYDTAIELGSWDANKNIIKSKEEGVCYDQTGKKIVCPTSLIKDTAPKDCLDSQDRSKKITCPANVYYVVSNPGKTKLANGSYSGWAVGDRAFWDGNSWQNWKCQPDSTGKCTVQKNPIKKRGVLQLQEDYSVAAKEILATLPKIMPMIGELDYCIPGPNPNWQLITGENSEPFFEIISSINSDYSSGGTLVQKEAEFYFPQEGQELYNNYQNVFRDLDKNLTDFWNSKVTQTFKWAEMKAFSSVIGLKTDENKEKVEEQASLIISDTAKAVSTFTTSYAEIIDKYYGKNSSFWREFNAREDTAVLTKNPGYLPMISAGSKITGNIFAYNDEVTELTEDYKKEIINAEANIYKLNEIKNEVSKIVVAAQNRRANKMIGKIKEEEGLTNFTIQDFEERYRDCLDQENINYYDDLEIMSGAENDAERCSDGIDNDGDGFIDMNDMDCNNVRRNSSDNFNPEDGFGSGAEPGSYRGGYNTLTNEPTYKGGVENTDKPLGFEGVLYEPICGNLEQKCIVGEMENLEEDEFLSSWECHSSIDPEYFIPCRGTLETITEAEMLEATKTFINDLKDKEVNWSALEYVKEYYNQKASDLASEGERLPQGEIWLTTTIDWLLGIRTQVERVVSVAGGLISLATGVFGLVNSIKAIVALI